MSGIADTPKPPYYAVIFSSHHTDGGKNICPKEIEEFLYTYPAIEEVQVTGDELRESCKGKIAHFKIPRNYKFVDEFPMTVTGNIQKFKVREIPIDKMGLQKQAPPAFRSYLKPRLCAGVCALCTLRIRS